MSNNHLRVDLSPREDRNNNIFYLGKLQYPGFIDCSAGVTFLIFLAEDGDEEIQIAPMDQDNNAYSIYTKKSDRVKIALENRLDQYKKLFYVCKFKYQGLIDCRQEASFIVFNANQGAEQLQIVAPIVKNLATPVPRKRGPEIIIRKQNRD